MANKDKGLKDPVDEKLGKDAQDALDDQMKTLDPSAQGGEDGQLSLDEVGAIHERRTAAPHPFDGYTMGRKVPVEGEVEVKGGGTEQLRLSSTYIVILKPSEEPVPDRSNANNTIYVSGVAGEGGTPDTGKPKKVTFPTSHTRVAADRFGVNHQVVFDRGIEISGQRYKCAIVPSHTIRAQLCFIFDGEKERVIPDKRYMLADPRQATRLLQLFRAVNWQSTKFERKAREFEAARENGPAPAGLVVTADGEEV